MSTVRVRLNEILERRGQGGNTELMDEILTLMESPHGLTKDEVKELTTKDLQRELNKNFDGMFVPIKLMQRAVNYGLTYGLESSHNGFVPMGNVMQWLMNQHEYSQELLLKGSDIEKISKDIINQADCLDADNWDRINFKTLVEHKRYLYSIVAILKL